MTVIKTVPAAVAILVFNEKRLLLGKRIKNRVFEGWQCPGGYLLGGESIETAARHYCLQKAGIEISDINSGPVTNNIFSEPAAARHTVSLYQTAKLHKIKNIEKFENREVNWSWFELNCLPQACYLPLQLLLQQHDLRQFVHN
ncbi:hypothetical protein MNBD_GAMMA09-1515 [hydrothermal vent metagenome]|uniref:Nudix hydrolase domain-containing protein n=1 Tax=hydrothermal vent metagenome TaxID=652676 RepID=A0A3B0X8P2_9ZZZZ